MSTHSELKSNLINFKGDAWRVVEGQYVASTMKLANSLEDQEILEDMLEVTKPPFPEEAERFDYLLATPFRYYPYPEGSRFRRAGQRDGVFYSSLTPYTALAELAFYRLLFWSHAEGARYPDAACEHTAFQVPVETDRAIDLTKPPFDTQPELLNKSDYTETQALADIARNEGVEVIISQSVRCPAAGKNINVFSLNALKAKSAKQRRTWTLFTRPDRVIVTSDFPKISYEFLAKDFDDPRLGWKLLEQ